MKDKELGRLMSQAANRATDAAIAAGYRRDDKVTKDSAFAAAQEVYRRERPEDFAAPPTPLATIPDPVQERMEREAGQPMVDDEEPF